MAGQEWGIHHGARAEAAGSYKISRNKAVARVTAHDAGFCNKKAASL